jgi:hypothetical protein
MIYYIYMYSKEWQLNIFHMLVVLSLINMISIEYKVSIFTADFEKNTIIVADK